MSKPVPNFSMDEIEGMIASVQEQMPQERNYFRTIELASWMGKSEKWARKQLTNLVQAGKVRYVGKRTFESVLTGDAIRAHAYEFVQEA